MKKQLLFFLCLLQVALVFSQNYPVRVTPQGIPPYPNSLSGYDNTDQLRSPINLLIEFNDLTAASRAVKLEVSIEGTNITATSRSIITGAPNITLDAGFPLRLNNAELAPYFALQNLRGVSAQQYNNILPDGLYRICFEVFDAFNGNKLSNTGCTNIFLVSSDPPFLNKPENRTNLTEQNPTNILFQWTPRHAGVPNVSYEFSLVEIWDRYADPQAVFLASPPIYQDITNATNLLYGPIQPLLLPGKRYAWRVRAIPTNASEEVSVFKNNGYSEIFWFDHASDCTPVTAVQVQDATLTTATISWIGQPEHLDYTIKYREKDGNRWYTKTTPRDYITIEEFKPDTVYEFVVLGNCDSESNGESPLKEFRTLTQELAEYTDCGIAPEDVDLSNQKLLSELRVNDVFTAGDFPVYVKKVSGSTTFSGEGYISTPWLATVRIPVTFDNIKINTDKKLVDGFVITTYDPNWGSIVDADAVIEEVTGDPGDKNVIKVDFDIIDVQVSKDGKTVTLIGKDGQEVVREGGKDVVYQDSEDENWEVSADGTVNKSQQADGGPATKETTTGMGGSGVDQITSTDVRVDFEKGNGYYAFDPYPTVTTGTLQDAYTTIDIAGGGSYYPPYKAISNLTGHPTDILLATATFQNSEYTTEDIVFKTKEGTEIPAEWVGNTATLTLEKKFDFVKEEIIATVKPKDTTQQYTIAGTANYWHLASQEVTDINVTLVPVNGASLDGIRERINQIYNPAGINFAVTEAAALSISDTTIDVGNSNLLSHYTDGEKAWIEQFKALGSYKRDTYYLFITDIPPTDADTDGFMPLKRQFGFVFAGQDKGRTAAHELGHGVFGLEHTFTEYNTDQGATNLLMDYGNGTAFTHMDWEKMHAPGLQLYWFQGDEDGEFASYQYLVGYNVVPDVFVNHLDSYTANSISFISAAGKIISLPNTAKDVAFGNGGTLFAFTIPENGKEERYVGGNIVREGEAIFKGYLKEFGVKEDWNQRVYKDNFSKNLSAQVDIYLGKLKKTKEDCGIELFTKNFANTASKNEWNSGGNNNPLVSTEFTSGLEVLKKVSSPEACDLCEDGEKFYDEYIYLSKNDIDTEALLNISKLICAKDETRIPYEILVAQFNRDFYENLKTLPWVSSKALFIRARDNFWETDNAMSIYLEALLKVNKNIQYYQERIKTNASKEDFYAALYYLNDKFIASLSFEERLEMLNFIFEHNIYITEGFFYADGKDDVSLIKKILSSLSNAQVSDLVASIIYNQSENTENLRYFLSEIIDTLNKDVLSSFSIENKLLILQVFLEEDLSNMFGNNEEAVVTKLISSVKDDEAQTFFDQLISSEKYQVDNEPLLYVIKNELSNFLNDDKSYTKFFLEINRLSNAINISNEGKLDIKTAITWDVKQRDFALIAFVENRNDYIYSYDNTTHTVSIKRCVEYDYEYVVKTDNVRKICKQEEFLLPKGSSPFDLVGILILNDVSPLASDCRDGIGNSELCGKLLVVPAIFIDYLNENVNIQRWQNLGWNTFNVAVTIATFGEGALAIQAIKGAAAGTRLTVTFQKSFQLLDFAYTATNIGMGLTQSGQFDCQNLSDPEEIKKCNEKWKIWNEIGLAFAVKGGLDLTENIIKATVKLKNLSREEIKQFIQAIKLKKYNKVATDDDVLKTVEELEELIYRNDDLKRQYEQLLAAANTDVPSFKTNFLSKLKSYPEDLSVFKNWVNSLAGEQASLLQKLDALGDDIVKLANDFDFSNSNAVSKFVNDPYLIDSWNVLKAFPQIRVKEDNIEVLSRVSGRFKYNNKNSFEGLFDLFNGSATSKQKLIDGLAKVDEVFDKSLPVTFSGIKAGEVKVNSIDGTGDEVARYTDGILQKKKSLDDGEVVGNYDGDDILKNGGEIGFRIKSDLLSRLESSSFTKLKENVYQLDGDLKAQFLGDFEGASDDLLKKLQDENLFNVWKNVVRSNEIDELTAALGRNGIREEYNFKVTSLANRKEKLLNEGKSIKEVSRILQAERRNLTIEYKHITPDDFLDWIFKRNDINYTQKGRGDKWGATFEGLFTSIAKRKGIDIDSASQSQLDEIYEAIAEGSSKTAGGTKKELGTNFYDFFKKAETSNIITESEFEDLVKVLEKYRML